MTWITTLGLFVVTALAEIVGCYLVLIWVKRDGPLLAMAGSVCSLMLFAWLLTRHPAESGRVYAAYGGVYTCTALAWLWLVDRVIPSPLDWAGVITIALGCGILVVSSFR